MCSTNENVIQYVPFSSFVHPSFWHTFSEMKLYIDKLDDTTKQIFGRFSYRDDMGCLFEVDGTSFNSTQQIDQFYANVTGTIINKNTIEEFKNIDKSSLLYSIGEMIWSNIKNKSWINNPNNLLNFFILSYADLKRYCYYYWFAFPTPRQPTVYLKEKAPLNEVFNEKQISTLSENHKTLNKAQQNFFMIIIRDEDLTIKPLSEILNSKDIVQTDFNHDLSKVAFGFCDPSNSDNPGWPLRIFIAALLEHCPSFSDKEIQIISLRFKVNGNIDSSQYYKVYIPKDAKSVESAGWVGWERNDRGNFGPKLANMSASMDPIKLAETSADLNVKLMKWRLVPDIDLDIMKNTKCLLLGAGTLGCHVARNLIGWGFKNITFLDNGRVSYSNPTRQVLFNHKDCHGDGMKKAEAAAQNLKDILPSAKTKALVAHIPMPGHPVGESLIDETLANVKIITEAIADHDVIFLLLDTREARWMPTLIAAHYGKIVINAALGFDSYLVMRHGSTSTDAPPLDESGPKHYIPGTELGCYFCTDVTAPGNSTKDRTLDQQCTVTRPGAAAIAGALAVELLVSLLQHNLKQNAPAVYNLKEDIDEDSISGAQSILGLVPHSIRGFLWSYKTMVPTYSKFKQCIGCSDHVISKYRKEGTEFLLKVFNDSKYLEEITGLVELQLSAEMTDILILDDSNEDST